MKESHVVTCFLNMEGKILILKRSEEVGSYAHKWAGVSGYIENGYTSLEQAFIEIREETRLGKDLLELVKIGNTLEISDEEIGTLWVVHPFRFKIKTMESILLDWEHMDYRWINPEELGSYDTVPGLLDAWEKVS